MDKIIAGMAFYYREPIAIDYGGQHVPNPRLVEARRWLDDKFVTVKAAERFAARVKKTFKPTATAPFPTLADFEEIDRMGFGMPEAPKIETVSESFASDQSFIGIESLIDRIVDIQKRFPDWSTSDIDFLHKYDVLDYIREHLEKIGWERRRVMGYLAACRDTIEQGKAVSLKGLPQQ